MRICCIFNIAPLYRKAIYRMMDADPRLDFDFLFGEESGGGIALLDAAELDGFRGYLRNIYRRSGKLIWQRKAIRKAFSKRYDAYILTGNPGIRSNWIIVFIARLLGRKVYLWTHGLRGNERGMKRKKNLCYFRLANHLLLYGERAKELLGKQDYPYERMTVIYNSLDYQKQLEIRNRISDRTVIRNYFGNDLPIITFVGRLTDGKRLDMLLDAVRPLACNLVLIGDGKIRGRLEKQAEDPELADRVWFYGETYDEQVIGSFLYHSAACVSPGNVGLTAIHALMFGTPVVTQDHLDEQMPESEVIIPGESGTFFQQDDTHALTEAVRPWLNQTPQERETVRRACYRIIDSTYNPSRQMEIIGSLFAP